MPRKPLSTTTRAWWLVGLTFLFLAIAFLLVVQTDGPPVDDSDLKMAEPIPEADSDAVANALASSFPGVTDPEQELIYEWEMNLYRKSSAPKPSGAPFLRKFGTKLDQWETKSQSPQLTRAIELHYDDLELFHSLRALKVAARLQLDSENFEAAYALSMAQLRIGKALQSAGGSTYQFSRGTSTSRAGVELLHELIAVRALPSRTLESLAADLPSLRPEPEEWAEGLRGHYAYRMQLLDELAKQRFDDPVWSLFFSHIARTRQRPFTFKRNATHRQLCDLFRNTLSDIETRTRGTKLFASQLTEEFNNGIVPLQALSGNLSGKLLVANVASDLTREIAAARKQQTEFALLELRIALERCRIESGSWPTRPEELVPTYLDRIPLDPNDGKPLRYDQPRRVIFSIGDDPVGPGVFPSSTPTHPTSPAPPTRQPIEIELESAP